LTGQLKLIVTNTDTLKSLTLNASGPVFLHPDGSATYRGASVLGGAGFLLLTAGTAVFVNDVPAVTGTTFDICAALGDGN
jgi:hypothetical protein